MSSGLVTTHRPTVQPARSQTLWLRPAGSDREAIRTHWVDYLKTNSVPIVLACGIQSAKPSARWDGTGKNAGSAM